MTDPEIASRFGEIYDATHMAALALITAKCGRTADIGDIFQDTFLELYKVLQKCKKGYIKNDKAFVLQITKKKIARYYKAAEKLRNDVPLSSMKNDVGEIELNEFDTSGFLMEDFAADKMMIESVTQKIKEKPEDVQKIFYLTYYMGMTIPEIAKALSISESGVKNKLYRTLKELRSIFN